MGEPPPTDDERRLTFVIRGDIISTTGYARAARAMAELLAERHRVLGVSIHEDPADKDAAFPGKLISDGEVRSVARGNPTVVVNHTIPDYFLPVPEACNVGAFYWETDAIPRRLFWPEHIASMDAIWAPTSFVADFVSGCGYGGPIALVPWAHRFEPGDFKQGGADLDIELLPRMGGAGDRKPDEWQSSSVERLRRDGCDLFLAIQSLSPRKGLPVLISEWQRHVRATPKASSVLLLKLNFRHAHGIGSDPRRHLIDLLRRYGIGDGEPIRIGLINRSLSDADMLRLTARSSVLVTSSYGEGFGGPIVEALSVGTPVIASRHTGIADLLPADYPLQYASRRVRTQLRDLINVYPSASSWFVPKPGALAGSLATFAAMDGPARQAVLSEGRAHAKSFCETSVVRERIRRAIAALPLERAIA